MIARDVRLIHAGIQARLRAALLDWLRWKTLRLLYNICFSICPGLLLHSALYFWNIEDFVFFNFTLLIFVLNQHRKEDCEEALISNDKLVLGVRVDYDAELSELPADESPVVMSVRGRVNLLQVAQVGIQWEETVLHLIRGKFFRSRHHCRLPHQHHECPDDGPDLHADNQVWVQSHLACFYVYNIFGRLLNDLLLD